MAEIVNLRQARKRKLRSAKEQSAAANRAKFGCAKSEKTKAVAEADRGQRHLDQAKLTPKKPT